MKSLMRLLARLYPKSWRARYGLEFDALIEDSPANLRGATDVLLTGLRLYGASFWMVAMVCGVFFGGLGIAISYYAGDSWIVQAKVQLEAGTNLDHTMRAAVHIPQLVSPGSDEVMSVQPAANHQAALELNAKDRDTAERFAQHAPSTFVIDAGVSDRISFRAVKFEVIHRTPYRFLFAFAGFLSGVLFAILIANLRRALA